MQFKGLWGLQNFRNRSVGYSIYNHMIDENLQKMFNPSENNIKGLDQSYL
jgi:hypothetical protein